MISDGVLDDHHMDELGTWMKLTAEIRRIEDGIYDGENRPAAESAVGVKKRRPGTVRHGGAWDIERNDRGMASRQSVG